MQSVELCDSLCPYGDRLSTTRIQRILEQIASNTPIPSSTAKIPHLQTDFHCNDDLGVTFVCFQGAASILGNCYRVPTLIEGFTWPSIQHYFHFKKAELFGDYHIASLIRSTTNSTYAKQLGRRVQNFDANVWEEVSTHVMTRGIYEKASSFTSFTCKVHFQFTQNEVCRAALLSTGNSVIVECGLYNLEWSNGLTKNDERNKDPRLWRSENRLGKVLVLVREHIYSLIV